MKSGEQPFTACSRVERHLIEEVVRFGRKLHPHHVRHERLKAVVDVPAVFIARQVMRGAVVGATWLTLDCFIVFIIAGKSFQKFVNHLISSFHTRART